MRLILLVLLSDATNITANTAAFISGVSSTAASSCIADLETRVWVSGQPVSGQVVYRLAEGMWWFFMSLLCMYVTAAECGTRIGRASRVARPIWAGLVGGGFFL
ncbi:hypothetical protein GCM10009555_072590 [Acrocarpospora macrocephala]|uniref:Uncharacterized protein n=2 Tax=Acrocarpospora macrocephala TaxID=150177 RepID=A0A5M3WHI5_9ACTN|nr:hypothetical protein Amac_021910 [Acrocarpospora macrocephala]